MADILQTTCGCRACSKLKEEYLQQDFARAYGAVAARLCVAWPPVRAHRRVLRDAVAAAGRRGAACPVQREGWQRVSWGVAAT